MWIIILIILQWKHICRTTIGMQVITILNYGEIKIMENVVKRKINLKKCENGSIHIIPINKLSVEPQLISKKIAESTIEESASGKVNFLREGIISKMIIIKTELIIISSGKQSVRLFRFDMATLNYKAN